ncbi:MAG: response regulator [Abitibacteriaceae bacterium]|nr:response regulator [Abditibacteriaceae bacterium]MBV9868620.1 response regulator [Abditibacteriaceae bacterium]
MSEISKKVLVVDDEEAICRALQLFLEQKGFEVALAHTGMAALSHVATTLPDLILLDVMMPGMDGLQVLQRLKEDERTKSIPVVILSAAAELQDLQKGWDKGTDVYLTKPIQMDQLASMVECILNP